jgi:hypothetical protein
LDSISDITTIRSSTDVCMWEGCLTTKFFCSLFYHKHHSSTLPCSPRAIVPQLFAPGWVSKTFTLLILSKESWC